MCGISAIITSKNDSSNYIKSIKTMLKIQNHRGPDNQSYSIIDNKVVLGHNRLSIIDLNKESSQPFYSNDSNYCITYNGEIYNYIELKNELIDFYNFKTNSDTEVLLASYMRWGIKSLEKFRGMFSFIIYDKINKEIIVCRDRFGVKPLYYAFDIKGNLFISSEIKTLHSIGIQKEKNEVLWSLYFLKGLYQFENQTFWKNIYQLDAGNYARIKINQNSIKIKSKKWYNFSERVLSIRNNKNYFFRNENEHLEEYKALLEESVKLRFRSDVKVGFNISGGLDSSTLLGVVNYLFPNNSINAFTFYCNDTRYDELPWVEEIIKETNQTLNKVLLKHNEIETLFEKVSNAQDEPFGGIPTIAYSNIFKIAKEKNVIVLLDGQGMDEAWAGYDYYHKQSNSVVQGLSSNPIIKDAISSSLALHIEDYKFDAPFNNELLDKQYRDIFFTKIPRALRFNDRISMMYSTELREPFLDHKLVEYAFSLPKKIKVKNGQTKWALRRLAKNYLKSNITTAPKRPLQTPQREWLKGPLQQWTYNKIQKNIKKNNTWFNPKEIEYHWNKFCNNEIDNSFFIWQWISAS